MTSVEELCKVITEWVVEYSWSESVFLTPEPTFNVDSSALLTELSERTGIPKEKFTEWSNAKADELDAAMKEDMKND